MVVELDREDLESLVKGSDGVYYSKQNSQLVKKAGYEYCTQYGKSKWNNLKDLTDEELYELYCVCKKSWN